MDFTELKNKTVEELKKILAENREEARSLRFKSKNKQLKSWNKIKEVKRVIAQINTVLILKKEEKSK